MSNINKHIVAILMPKCVECLPLITLKGLPTGMQPIQDQHSLETSQLICAANKLTIFDIKIVFV